MDMEALYQSKTANAWGLFIWPLLTTLSLLLLSEGIRLAPCWAMTLPVLLLAYPLWLTSRESALFKRRILLSGAIREEALTRRLFWGGQLGAAILVVPALILALLLLAMAARLSAWQWAVLILDALVVTGLYRFFQRRAASQVRPEMLGIAVRGWPLRLANLGLLAVAFFVLDFFVIGASDVRHDSWHAVIEQAFNDERQGFGCHWIGLLVGSLGALDQARWVLAQQLIPTLSGPELRVMVWVAFLLTLGLLSFVFTQLLLGVIVLVEQRGIRAESFTGESTVGKTFVLTILVLALFPLYVVLQLRDQDPSDFQSPASDFQSPAPAVLSWIDPCRDQADESAEYASALDARIQAREAEIRREIEPRVARELDLLFASVESAVDDYLDWYFTIAGEYQRLAALVEANGLEQLMGEKLEAHLFEATDFHARLSVIDNAMQDDALKALANVSKEVHDDLLARMRDNPCASSTMHIEHLGQLERDVWRASAAVTTGATFGLATSISKALVATVVTKVAGKKSVQAAGVMLVKLAAKKGGGVLAGAAGGAAVCSPAGPVAIVCGIASGVATWLVVDKVFIEIDEAVSRDEMRADILSVLAEEKAALRESLVARYSTLVAAGANTIRSTTDGVFIPARDGV